MQRHIFFLTLGIFCSLPSFSEVTRLQFETTDGSVKQIPIENLEIIFEEGNLIATQDENELILPLDQLISMRFKDAESKISDMVIDPIKDLTLYDISGVKIGNYNSLEDLLNLPKGIYIIQDSKGNTIKISI